MPAGICANINDMVSFRLLREDENARLVLYFHSAAGTMAMSHRPDSYHTIAASSPRTHILAFNYRGFGRSTGAPCELGLLEDALAVVKFAMEDLGVPARRIVLLGQSLGTGVVMKLAHEMTTRTDPILLRGIVLMSPFTNIASLTKTFRLGGVVPVLSPLSYFPYLVAFFNGFLVDQWDSGDNLAGFLSACRDMKMSQSKENFNITVLHAEDDPRIPWTQSKELLWRAANALRSGAECLAEVDFNKEVERKRVDLGAGGWEVEWRLDHGIFKLHILKYGLHGPLMRHSALSLAISRAFEGTIETAV